MGDAPMMPDGSQNGQPTTAASADAAVAGYLSDLREAVTILSEAYGFNPGRSRYLVMIFVIIERP